MEWLLLSWPTLILLGLAMRMALRLTYGVRGPEPGDPVFIFLNITSWVFIAISVVPAIVGGVLSLFGVIIMLLAIATLIEAIIQRRLAQRRSMCRMLVLLMERGAQLESSVLLAGQTMSGIVGRAAKRLFSALRSGTPLPDAVSRNPGALPRLAPAYLAAGQSSEVRVAALRELSRAGQGELESIWRASVDRILYLASILLFMAVVLTFVMIRIVPEYAKIFDEFELDLPAMTYLLVSLSDFVVNYLAAPLILVVLATACAATVISICYLCDVPILTSFSDRLFRGRRTADVLRIVALATEHHEPLDGVLNRLALVFPSPLIRRWLLHAAAAVEAGADWRDALLDAGIISRVEQSLLKTAEQVGNLPWALREIANRREKRAAYRIMAALQIVYPIAILVIGAFVAFYAVSLLIPIVRLIQGLSN